MRRLPVLVIAGAAIGYAAAAYLLLLPPVVLPPHQNLADLPAGSCADRAFIGAVQERGEILFVPLADVPTAIQERLLRQEDGAFFAHRGVEWRAMARAVGRDIGAGRFLYGASTVTMQLARELFLDKSRTIARKLREIAYALQLERRLDKQQILELYINVVDWGPGLRGIGAASCFYYGVPPAQLSPDQIVQLVALLPSPRRLAAESKLVAPAAEETP